MHSIYFILSANFGIKKVLISITHTSVTTDSICDLVLATCKFYNFIFFQINFLLRFYKALISLNSHYSPPFSLISLTLISNLVLGLKHSSYIGVLLLS